MKLNNTQAKALAAQIHSQLSEEVRKKREKISVQIERATEERIKAFKASDIYQKHFIEPVEALEFLLKAHKVDSRVPNLSPKTINRAIYYNNDVRTSIDLIKRDINNFAEQRIKEEVAESFVMKPFPSKEAIYNEIIVSTIEVDNLDDLRERVIKVFSW